MTPVLNHSALAHISGPFFYCPTSREYINVSRAGNSSMYKLTLRAKFYCKPGREFDTYGLKAPYLSATFEFMNALG